MDTYDYLIKTFGYNEPIFINVELTDQDVATLLEQNKIKKYDDDIYFIPNPDALIKSNSLSPSKVINKKYIFSGNKRIGYVTGLAFANRLYLTTQVPFSTEIVTMNTTDEEKEVDFKSKKIILRKPISNIEINKDNYKVFQIIDLLRNFDALSTRPVEEAVKLIDAYLKGE